MKILHFSNSFLRDVTGGTEVFITRLIYEQQYRNKIVWGAHQDNQHQSLGRDKSKDITLQMLPPVLIGDRLESASHRCKQATKFSELLDQLQPDIVHFHSLSPKCGLNHIQLAKVASVKAVMTVHAPGFTCMQGSLLYHRDEICDGLIRDQRCTECRLVNGGLPKPLAHLVSTYDWPQLSSEGNSKISHVLTARQLTSAFRQAWLEVAEQVDAFHVLCDWSRQVLLKNGVPESKLHLIRTAGPEPLPPRQRKPMEDGILRCVYWGRCAEVKGIHLIVDAVKALPQELPVEISFYGPYWDSAYGQEMQKRINKDPRFAIHGNLQKEKVLNSLQDYDVALIPSTWLETGPLTVLEAFAAGLPVIGSDLGGIKELLQGQRGCFLVPPKSAEWSKLLDKLVHSPSDLVNPDYQYHRFKQIAEKLEKIYRDLVLL